jgi:lantibiotic modifying enzyme
VTGLTGYWWTRGLTLAERLAAGPVPATRCADEAAARRLDRWRTAYPDLPLGEDELRALLAEAPESLGARVARPAWADDVEAALEAAPAHSGPVPPETGSWLAAFAHVLRPFVTVAVDRIGADSAVADRFAELLGERLAMIAARTLVLEVNLARVDGQLSGATPQERFADFIRRRSERAGLAVLLDSYPVLARLLAEACRYGVEAHREAVDRFRADRADIVAKLLSGVDPGPLVAVESGLGDLHRHGRSVAVLRFAGGRRIVYKPRSLAVHEHFADLVGWLNGSVPGLDLRTVPVIARDGYGWLEYIPDRPCGSAREVRLFYRRQGAILALLYALEAADIHYENLIACGDQPVLVDLETLFHLDPPRPASAIADPAADALAASVLRTHLLPRLMLGEYGSLDVSGLGGDRGAVFPTDVTGWTMPATDRMRLTRGAGEFAGGRNRPRLAGVDQDPVDYSDALLAGFRAGYDAIAAGAAEFVELIERCRADEIRVVIRPTQLYRRLIVESTHPDVLRDALDRDRVLYALWSASVDDPARLRLVPHELADLWAGDIPLFTSRPDARDIWSAGGVSGAGGVAGAGSGSGGVAGTGSGAGGTRISDMLEIAGLTSSVAKVTRMGGVDRRDQEWLITAALATRRRWRGHAVGEPYAGNLTPTAPDPRRLLAAACGIADQIAARAIVGEDRANWLGLELLDGTGWAARQMGAGLAEGYSGVALFLGQTWALTGVSRYRQLARLAMRPVPRLLDAFAARPEVLPLVGCGGLHGLGGTVYALARLATLVDDPRLLEAAATGTELTVALLSRDGEELPLSVADGLAGCLAAMMAVAVETGLPGADRAAELCANRLVGAADLGLGGGFAEGGAGIGWALGRYGAYRSPSGGRYVEAGRAALGAYDHRPPEEPSFCTGTAGILIARGGEPLTWLDELTDRPLGQDLSLCHGEAGIGDALTVLASTNGDERAASARARHSGLMLSALHRYGPRCGVPGQVDTPGLLTGLAGIGYGLLRLAYADRVPSVLLFEPAP